MRGSAALVLCLGCCVSASSPSRAPAAPIFNSRIIIADEAEGAVCPTRNVQPAPTDDCGPEEAYCVAPCASITMQCRGQESHCSCVNTDCECKGIESKCYYKLGKNCTATGDGAACISTKDGYSHAPLCGVAGNEPCTGVSDCKDLACRPAPADKPTSVPNHCAYKAGFIIPDNQICNYGDDHYGCVASTCKFHDGMTCSGRDQTCMCGDNECVCQGNNIKCYYADGLGRKCTGNGDCIATKYGYKEGYEGCMPACTPGVAGWSPGDKPGGGNNSNSTPGGPTDDFFTANWKYFALAVAAVILVAVGFFMSKATHKRNGKIDRSSMSGENIADPLMPNPAQDSMDRTYTYGATGPVALPGDQHVATGTASTSESSSLAGPNVVQPIVNPVAQRPAFVPAFRDPVDSGAEETAAAADAPLAAADAPLASHRRNSDPSEDGGSTLLDTE